MQPVLNPFVTMTADLALDAARQAERAIMSGDAEAAACAGFPSPSRI